MPARTPKKLYSYETPKGSGIWVHSEQSVSLFIMKRLNFDVNRYCIENGIVAKSDSSKAHATVCHIRKNKIGSIGRTLFINSSIETYMKENINRVPRDNKIFTKKPKNKKFPTCSSGVATEDHSNTVYLYRDQEFMAKIQSGKNELRERIKTERMAIYQELIQDYDVSKIEDWKKIMVVRNNIFP